MDEPPRPPAAGVRRLTPDTATIFSGTFSLLHCAVKDDTLYRGVFAVRMFPVRQPDRYVSLRHTDERDKDREIGVIENLDLFPADQRALVAGSLGAHYLEQIIRRVFDVTSDLGLLFFDVQTQHGRRRFIMPWRGDRAEDYGENGKVLLDASDNRFVIPDLDALPQADRRRFASYVYW